MPSKAAAFIHNIKAAESHACMQAIHTAEINYGLKRSYIAFYSEPNTQIVRDKKA